MAQLLLDTALVAMGIEPDHKRNAFRGWTSNSIEDFAAQHDFASMYENLKEYDGIRYGNNNARTFRLMPAEKAKILALVHWSHTCIAQGIGLDVANFTNEATMQIWSQRSKEIIELTKRKSDSRSRVEDDFVKIEPGMFKQLSQWEDMKDLIRKALSHMHTWQWVGDLRYLIRDELDNHAPNNNIDVITVYQGNFDKMAEETLMIHLPPDVEIADARVQATGQRERVRQDSARLWTLLETMTSKQPTYNLIRTYKTSANGIAAYCRLKVEAEGITARTTKKNLAYQTIKNTYFSGRTARFTFSSYVERLEGAFAALEEEGEPQAESRKVSELLVHITDPRLAVAKDIVTGDPTKLENFQAASQYLGTCLANRMSTQPSPNPRGIAEAEKGGKQGSGREVDAIEEESSGIEWKSGRYIPSSEYNLLKKWEKEAHRKIVRAMPDEERAKKRGAGKNQRSKKNKKSKKEPGREAGSVQSEGKADDGTKEVPATSPASNQFGRNSHKNKKKAVSIKEPEKKDE